ncbi:uncharacterized protein BDW47DRAFT_101220 [Aspergillus candidus]|uniref:DUF7907 domain-containing protein n=1 Tax=Aspergillus candidus TaxID=41067 RepID=A0A2I2FIN7_ASPCN|nr:hypothetical protein BDW47DRAFT_101220 [Aspergillus candidus]PLB40498.1 hypothetical protein BDW47DRAFT_101220 [Aspergillus candidus]
MKLLSSLVLLVSAVAANPVLSARGSNDDPKLFHLKTSGASNQDHDGLYVYGYHTGAGLNDAGLTADLDTAKPAFLNSTNVQFAFDTPFPWGITMRGANNYGSWEPVEINTGYGSGAFSIDGDNLKWSEKQGFGGWLVCDWYHNEPQLFYLYRFKEATALPSSCTKVDLKVEYLSE